MTKIGYARISTDQQLLDLQLDALKKAGCTKIFKDTISGSKASRDGLDKMLEYAREGDAVVVYRLDRLGRSLKNLIELSELLASKGINLQSLQESINTSTANGKMYFNMMAVLAEFERNLIRERSQAGLEAARARGRKGGRPFKLDNDKAALVRKMYDSKQYTTAQICEVVGISRPTLYKYIDKKSTNNVP